MIPVTTLLVALATAPAESPPAPEPELTKLPVLTSFVEAPYPERARADGIEAAVLLEIDIDAEGKVERATVVGPADPAGYGFDEAALAAVRQFVFEPAEAGGVPLPVRITYKYRFELAAAPPPVAPSPVENFGGRLLERGTRNALAGIRVTVFEDGGRAFETLSAADGSFHFFDLKEGEWKVIVEAEGYYPYRTTETIVADEKTDATYHVERRSYDPNDVLVEGKRARKEVTRRTLAVQEIEKVPGTFGDPVAVVSNMPSVARVPYGAGLLMVRGSSPEDTHILADGIRIPTVYHFGGMRSVLPSGMIERIDFYPGNFSVEYGRAIGGVLDVELKRLSPTRASGYIDVSLMDTGVYVEAPVGEDAAIAAALRRSYFDFVLDAAIPDDATLSFSTAPRFYDMQLLGTYRPSSRQRLDVFLFGSDDRMAFVAESPADLDASLKSGRFEASTRFYRALLEHGYTGDVLENEAKLSIGYDDDSQALGPQFSLDIESTTLQLHDRLRVALGPAVTLTLGVDYVTSRTSAYVRSLGIRPIKEGDLPYTESRSEVITSELDASVAHYPAAYVEAELRPLSGLLVVPGLRADYFGMSDTLVFDPRLTLRYVVTPTVSAKAAAGLFHQEPTGDELVAGFGNPDLGPERAAHYSLGGEWRPFEKLSVDVTAFYKDMRDLVGRSTALVERHGELVPEVYSNGGRGRVYGVDLLVRHELARNFFGWLSYTLSRAERRDPGASGYRLFDHDQTHIVTAVASYRLPRNWELGLRWRYTTGDPQTPVIGGVYASDSDTYRPVSGEPYSTRIDPFHQLDVRLDKRWVYDGWMLDAYVDLQNGYDRRGAEMYQYNFDYSQKRKTGGLPLLPIIGLRAEL